VIDSEKDEDEKTLVHTIDHRGVQGALLQLAVGQSTQDCGRQVAVSRERRCTCCEWHKEVR